MTDAETLYCNVERICKEQGITITDVERRTGYIKGHLRGIVKRGGRIHLDHIRFYAEALGVRPERLLEGMLE